MRRSPYLALAGFACILHAKPTTPVILISIDTLRADHLSCYQSGTEPTPHIDSLAKDGTLFSQVSTPFPLTLPAHVSLFTSTYPFGNAVEDNGIPLAPRAATLATLLKRAGYHTAAFVSSFVLERRFGLNQGFDVYDGPLDVHHKAAPGPIERKRPGSQTAEAALRWLDSNSTAPFFLFLHLYDLHLPYDLPQGYRAEVQYEDRVIGHFLAELRRRGLLSRGLIVFTSDHGEGLGEHGESTHGYFIYQSTLQVPLIMHWPAGAQRISQARINEPASLLDVAPTILHAIGLTSPVEMRGRSLFDIRAPGEIYSESLYAHNHFGCASLRSLRFGQYKYIQAPKPELYDLSADPHETKNIFEQQRAKAAALSARIPPLRASVKPPARSSQTIQALRSLGYLSGSPSRAESGVDPKDRIADFEHYFAALSLADTGQLAESIRALEKLRDKLPEVSDIRIHLGMDFERLGQFAPAAREFEVAARESPSDAQARFELGFCDYQLHQLPAATRALEAALAIEPWYTRADEALADIYIQQKNYPEARAHLNHLLVIDPSSYTAYYNLGILAAMNQN